MGKISRFEELNRARFQTNTKNKLKQIKYSYGSKGLIFR